MIYDPHKLYDASDPALLPLGEPTTMRHWRQEGRGPNYIKNGHRILYSGAQLNAYIDQCTVHCVNAKAITANRPAARTTTLGRIQQ